MNWYKKIAAPLPESDGFKDNLYDKKTYDRYHEDYYTPDGIGRIDKYLKEPYINNKINDYIGAGSYGIAYQLDNGNVLKVTTEKDEFKNSQKLMSNPCPGVVNVFNSKIIQETPKPVYAIEIEKVTPLSIEQRNLYDHVEYFAEETDRLYETSELQEFKKWYSPEAEEMYLKLRDMFIHIESSGWQIHDVHAENVGIRNGEFVVLDLGGIL